MYYYLLEGFLPVQSMHIKQPGEKHNSEISWSVIKESITLEQYDMAQRLIEETRKGQTTIPQSHLQATLGMERVVGIMIAATQTKRDKVRAATQPRKPVQRANPNEYDYNEATTVNRSADDERARELDLNVRNMMLDKTVESIATTPLELVKQLRKAQTMKSFAGIERIMKAIELQALALQLCDEQDQTQ